MSVVHGVVPLRVLGGILLGVAFLELAIDAAVYSQITSPRLGAWWAAILFIITSILGLASVNRATVVAACVLSVISIIVGIIGCFVDCIASEVIKSLNECTNGAGSNFGGTSNSQTLANCVFTYYSDNHDCYCVQSTGDTCFFYSGPAAEDSCGNIMGSWSRNLSAGAAFDVLATITCFALSIIICCSLCCPQNLGSYQATTEQGTLPGQTVVVVGQPQPVYVQNAPQAPQPVYGSQPQPVYAPQPPQPVYAQPPAAYTQPSGPVVYAVAAPPPPQK